MPNLFLIFISSLFIFIPLVKADDDLLELLQIVSFNSDDETLRLMGSIINRLKQEVIDFPTAVSDFEENGSLVLVLAVMIMLILIYVLEQKPSKLTE